MLPGAELRELRAWLDEYEDRMWDEQFQGCDHRAVALETDGGLVWLWIGPHDPMNAGWGDLADRMHNGLVHRTGRSGLLGNSAPPPEREITVARI